MGEDKMPHKRHKPAVLDEMLEHVVYEIDMLLHHFEGYKRDARSNFGNNRNIEGFLLHFRVLRDFLWPQIILREDDLAAWEYCGDTWREYGDKAALYSKKHEIDKRLMHLSVTRTMQVNYALPALFKAFGDAFVEFHKGVDPRRKKGLERRVERIKSELRESCLGRSAGSSTTTCSDSMVVDLGEGGEGGKASA